ncbi:Lipase member H-A [Papilio machaon]|uniref:Lipase member H-A n=1 Tax=Papilio machaon TaxID=76193 RepID=A0A194QZ66_PAPMA|nr:Lipase member H-A [Papilio machaon]
MNSTTKLSEETKLSLSVVFFWPKSHIFEINEKKCNFGPDGAACIASVLHFKRRKTQVLISGYLDASFSPMARMVLDPYLKLGRNVIVLISGYLDASFSPMARMVLDPYLKLGRNVIVMEMFPILYRSYPIAARLTKPLGYLLGELLAQLAHRGLSHKDIELLGASLGAHIAYHAAIKYHQLTNRKPMRLTGLDPAGPCFRNLAPDDRFSASAAHMVDALHTNMDGFGLADTVGHIDIYANGGEYQQSMVNGFLLPCLTLCSHMRSAMYWVSALNNPDKFLAVRCQSVSRARHGDCYDQQLVTNVLGSNTDFNKPGIYYLPTNETDPYYIYKEALVKRPYGPNAYLLKVSPDEDMII